MRTAREPHETGGQAGVETTWPRCSEQQSSSPNALLYMSDATLNRRSWDSHAVLRLEAEHDLVRIPSRFDWMQFPGQGPGEELFGAIENTDVVEIGCGPGNQLAFLASRGARGIGLDISPRQVSRAHVRWQYRFHTLRFIVSDAMELPAHISPKNVDTIYSVFGAVGFCDPHMLLPVIHRCLRPSGRLLFSVPHPLWDQAFSRISTPPNGRLFAHITLPNSQPAAVVRYQYSVQEWLSIAQGSDYIVENVFELRVDPQKALIISPTNIVLERSLAEIPCCLLMVLRRR